MKRKDKGTLTQGKMPAKRPTPASRAPAAAVPYSPEHYQRQLAAPQKAMATRMRDLATQKKLSGARSAAESQRAAADAQRATSLAESQRLFAALGTPLQPVRVVSTVDGFRAEVLEQEDELAQQRGREPARIGDPLASRKGDESGEIALVRLDGIGRVPRLEGKMIAERGEVKRHHQFRWQVADAHGVDQGSVGRGGQLGEELLEGRPGVGFGGGEGLGDHEETPRQVIA